MDKPFSFDDVEANGLFTSISSESSGSDMERKPNVHIAASQNPSISVCSPGNEDIISPREDTKHMIH